MQITFNSVVSGQIISSLGFVSGWLLKGVYLRVKLQSKKARRKTLEDLESPDFVMKSQRNAFRWLAMAMYCLGAYLFFSLTLKPAKLALAFEFIAAALILLCSGMAAANSAGMNDYGLKMLKAAYASETAKKEQRAARKRELEELR